MQQNFTLNLALVCSLITTHCTIVSMNKEEKIEENLLEQSQIIPVVPTTRGFGIFRSAKDYWRSEEENLFLDLQSKAFDINNSSYHRKLSTAIEKFVQAENDSRITEILNICRTEYRLTLKIEDTSAMMMHIFLTKQNKKKQQELKEELQGKDEIAIDKINSSLVSLKKTLHGQISSMHELSHEHNKAQEQKIKTESAEIKRLKIGLVTIHAINKHFKLPTDGYCSDEDQQGHQKIEDFYGNDHILAKIKIDKKLEETKSKIEKLLQTLRTLHEQINDIKELTYI